MVQTFCMPHHFMILLTSSILLLLTNGQTVIKSARLDPVNTYFSGANIISNIAEVIPASDTWSTTVSRQSTWQFILSLDSSWLFDPVSTSAITITINSPSISTSDLLFGFTTDNAQYISMSLPMDNTGRNAQIYPACNSPSFPAGDIAALPANHRFCDIAGGACSNWQNPGFNTQNVGIPPFNQHITLTLENNPSSSTFSIYLGSASFTTSTMTAKCAYTTTLNNAYNALKLYIAGTAPGETFVITSVDIVSAIKDLTPSNPTNTNPAIPVNPFNTIPGTVLNPIATQPAIVGHVDPPFPVSTEKPTTTLGIGQILGAFDQICADPISDLVCLETTDHAMSDTSGYLECGQDHDCCLCASIQCGTDSAPCSKLLAGPSGIFGVKDVYIEGMAAGAEIDCMGIEACSQSDITATNIRSIRASGDMALKNAKVTVTKPMYKFTLDCIAMGGCEGLELELIIPGPPAGYQCNPALSYQTFVIDRIICSQTESCKDMTLTVRNDGCHTVEIATLECIDYGSCDGATFNFVGDVDVNNCNFPGGVHGIQGVDKCFENLEKLLCPDSTSCNEAMVTMKNPVNGFMLSCGNNGACESAQFLIELNSDALVPIQYFEGFKFAGLASGAGARIIIDNQQGISLNIDQIECASIHSCADTEFIIGDNVVIGRVICSANTCSGCLIKKNINDVGIPCDHTEIQGIAQPNVPPQFQQLPNSNVPALFQPVPGFAPPV